MYWLVSVSGNGQDVLDSQVTVKADNWFSALSASSQEEGSTALSNITCMPKENGEIEVKDFVSGRTYHLLQFSKDILSQNVANGEDDGIELFGSKDIVAQEGGVSYRERQIRVPAGVPIVHCEEIGHKVLVANQIARSDDQLVVVVNVYDHKFSKRPLRPALVRVTWQQWEPDAYKVEHPQVDAEEELLKSEATTVHPGDTIIVDLHPPADSPAAAEIVELHPPVDAAPPTDNVDSPPPLEDTEPIDLHPEMSVNRPNIEHNMQHHIVPIHKESAKKKSLFSNAPKKMEKVNPKKGRQRQARTKSSKVAKGQHSIASVDDAVVLAFEKMQDMYAVKNHDAAAVFVRDTLMDIACAKECLVMLTSPGKYELYIAAQKGFDEAMVAGLRVSMLTGIVGYTVKTGVVVNIIDASDERLNKDVDVHGQLPVTNLLCAPISFEGRIFGVIELMNPINTELFSQEQVNAVSYVAGALAEFIQVSLPCREADFHDREFELLKKQKARDAASKAEKRAKSAISKSSPSPQATKVAVKKTKKVKKVNTNKISKKKRKQTSHSDEKKQTRIKRSSSVRIKSN